MNDPLYHELRELCWRHKLTDAQEARLRSLLAAYPEAQDDWEGQAGLNQLLEQLPPVPVASNFTARVLQAVEREAAGPARAANTWWKQWWLSSGWVPKTAVAAVLICVGLLGYQQHRIIRREEIAHSLPKVSSVISLSSPQIWEDFDVINKLSHTQSPADTQLLALMQ